MSNFQHFLCNLWEIYNSYLFFDYFSLRWNSYDLCTPKSRSIDHCSICDFHCGTQDCNPSIQNFASNTFDMISRQKTHLIETHWGSQRSWLYCYLYSRSQSHHRFVEIHLEILLDMKNIHYKKILFERYLMISHTSKSYTNLRILFFYERRRTLACPFWCRSDKGNMLGYYHKFPPIPQCTSHLKSKPIWHHLCYWISER